jgi:hypothetical protein
MKAVRLIVTLVCLGFLLQVNAWAGDTLSDVLKEKGMITKEDWIRIQAAEEKKAEEQQKALEEEFPVIAGWGKKGFTLETRDGLWKTAIQWRFQGRYSYSRRTDADEASDFDATNESTFELRRVRMKVGGHGYKPWIKYYFEMNWQSTTTSGNSPEIVRPTQELHCSIGESISVNSSGYNCGWVNGKSIITVSAWTPRVNSSSSNDQLSRIHSP